MRRGQTGSAYRHLHTLFDVGTVAGLTDGELLERFATRNGEAAELAFAALVERHGPLVLRTCRRTLRDHHDAQDAFQATFLVLVRKAGTLWVRDSLGPWLYNVACRVAAYAKVAQARRRVHEQRCAEMAPLHALEQDPDDSSVVLHDEINRLPERLRVAVVLCYLEGLTHEQTALQLGWPVGTVRSRLAHARERLRARLVRRGLAPSCALLGAGLTARPATAALPATLAESTVQFAMRVAAGQAASAGTVSASVATLTTGVLRAMFLTKLKAIAAVVVGLGFVAAGAGVLAQTRPETLPPRPTVQPAAPSLKFEIRTWKNGAESDGPITVEISGAALHQVETPDAVIQIRPRRSSGQGDRWPEVRKEPLRTGALDRETRPLAEESSAPFLVGKRQAPSDRGNDPFVATGKLPGGDSTPFRTHTLRNQNVPDATKDGPQTQPLGEQERRLEQVERKLDQILKELGRAPWREKEDQSPLPAAK